MTAPAARPGPLAAWPWAWVGLALALSVGLGQAARVGGVGERFWVVLGCAAVLGGCVRVFERLLWWRFPASTEATVAGAWTLRAVAALLAVHAALVVLGV